MRQRDERVRYVEREHFQMLAQATQVAPRLQQAQSERQASHFLARVGRRGPMRRALSLGGRARAAPCLATDHVSTAADARLSLREGEAAIILEAARVAARRSQLAVGTRVRRLIG